MNRRFRKGEDADESPLPQLRSFCAYLDRSLLGTAGVSATPHGSWTIYGD
jgi:hypothetical protein